MLALRTGLATGLTTPVTVLNRVLVRYYDGIVVTSSFASGEFQGLAAAAGTPVHQAALGVDLETFSPRRPASQESRPTASGALGQAVAGTESTSGRRHGGDPARTRCGRASRRLGRRPAPRRAGRARRRRTGHLSWSPLRQGDAQPAHRSRRHRTVGLPRRDLRLAVLDALACGTPVVTADVGGARELVDDHSGWWATPYPQALAHAVLRLAARPVAARRAAARRRAEQFPWTSTVEAMLDLHRGGAPGEGTHTTCSA
jgi:alpha-1,6-mannosyltransferase